MFINDVFIKKTDDLIAFWDRFVVPMLKDKQHVRQYGEMTFFLEQDERELFGPEKHTFLFDYEEALNAFNKFKAVEDHMERAHYYFNQDECAEKPTADFLPVFSQGTPDKCMLCQCPEWDVDSNSCKSVGPF